MALSQAQQATASYLGLTEEEFRERDRLIDLGRSTLLQCRELLMDVIGQMGNDRPGRFSQCLDGVLESVNQGLRCGDCGVVPGVMHFPGCDVERCKNCGWQAISCGCQMAAEGTIWTGVWPGDVEVKEYGYEDLNALAVACARGELTWDRDKERWVK